MNHEGTKTRRQKKKFAFVISILFVFFVSSWFNLNCFAADEFQQAIQPREWNFPRDHGRHDGFKIEWWYFTGNLQDSTGRRFGYQLTFFRSAFGSKKIDRASNWGMTDAYFAHAAISDIQNGQFIFKDRLERSRPELAGASDRTLDVMLLDWSAKLTEGKIHLHSAEKNFEIDLTCTNGRGPILQGPGGVNAKGSQPGQASYYYSMTRLKTAGSLTVAGQKFDVQGQSWMDHEFSSNALAKNQVGWDWMGLELNDGTDLMLYRMRNADGRADYLSGTRVTADGVPHYLSTRDISLAGSHPWESPASGDSYPQQWSVRCTGLPALVVKTLIPGQELITKNSTNVTYFEGASEVLNEQGQPIGEGYLEMTSPGSGSSFQSPQIGPAAIEDK